MVNIIKFKKGEYYKVITQPYVDGMKEPDRDIIRIKDVNSKEVMIETMYYNRLAFDDKHMFPIKYMLNEHKFTKITEEEAEDLIMCWKI